MKNKIEKNIIIVITVLLIGTLQTSYLMAGKLSKFKKVLTGEAEEKTEESKEGAKTEEAEEEKKGKLEQFFEEIKSPERTYEPRRPVIIKPEPWYRRSRYLHRYPGNYYSLQDYYRDLYFRNYISYDEYQVLLDRFRYLDTEIPQRQRVVEKKLPKSERELRISLTNQFADDISSGTISFYYLGEARLALDVRYTDYREDLDNGTDHLQQIDIMPLYQLYYKEAQVLLGAGIKAFYGNGNQWGFKLGIGTRVPLTERLSLSIDPELAFVSDEIVTELDARIDYQITDNISAILGYKSLSLPGEDLTIEGLHLGIGLFFK